MTPVLKEIARSIKRHADFLVTTHLHPDGDAVGSVIGLMLVLEKMGKTATVCLADPISDALSFLPGADRVIVGVNNVPDHVWDAVIVVDSASLERTGMFESRPIPAKCIINIDHHLSSEEFGNLNWIDPRSAAAGEMVYELAKTLGVELDQAIAVNLYTSIITDTGFFRYSNTTARTHRIVAKLVETGFNAGKISEQLYETRSYDTLRLLGEVLARMERSDDGRIAWTVISEDMFRRTGTSAHDIEGFVNYPRSIKGVDVAVLIRENGNDLCKVSIRSKGKINVAVFAEKYGGGGHRNASGCTIAGRPEDVKAQVIGGLVSMLAGVKEAGVKDAEVKQDHPATPDIAQ